MQYGRAIEHLIRDVVIAEPLLGPMHILKEDVSDDFYSIGLRPTDAPKMGLVSPSEVEDEELVSIPLTIPMGWKSATHILHEVGDSGRSSKCSLVIQYPIFKS